MTGEQIPDTCGFVAVIGMAARVPGAEGVDGFWDALVRGDELITRFPVPAGRDHVPAYGVVAGADEFDAAFFGYAPREALLLDPQHRVFLECAWEALENAGYDPAGCDRTVGVFGGSGDTGHFAALLADRAALPGTSEWQLRLASGADFLTSRVSYKLGLNGPAVTVQTACSTSLVAVHVAVQSLLAGDCDLALAGGVTLRVPHPVDEFSDDGVLSRDGHCRAFDAAAGGTVASDGAGVVVLKRYDEAVLDGDDIRAVIRGSAVNNDGSAKAGFTAPSVDGQAAAARLALSVAGVDAADVGYVEAHGTGTPVGDPIEVRALAKAYAVPRGSVALGSVKANLGHTDAASGVLGLIKAVLALRHEVIPGTLHFREPNPALDLDRTPFRVSARARSWPRSARPRRAAVNSLGIGGTNAHVVLEEAPATPPREAGRPYHLLPLSARTATALRSSADRLAAALADGDLAPADVAWTLQTGRSAFGHRGFVVAADARQAGTALTGDGTSATRSPDRPRPVAFLFPGQGGQYVDMGRDLYRHEPVFRAAVDRCSRLAGAQLGFDLRTMLYPRAGGHDEAATRMAGMLGGQAAVFTVQYALATLWRSWGVEPALVLGHSLGAYAAATVAGTLDVADALALVLHRGRILGELPSGAMLAVSLPAGELLPILDDGVAIAAVNGPRQCVVTGPAARIAAVQAALAGRDVEARLLHISAAAHSPLVEPALPEFERLVAGVPLHPPALPWISDRTGQPVTAAQAGTPSYWSGHLRHTVQFDAALRTLFAAGEHALLEIGPGRTLAGLARRHPGCGPDRPVVASLPHAADDAGGGGLTMMSALGRLWQQGVPVDWAGVHAGEPRRRVELPAYPFERQRFRLPGQGGTGFAPVDETPPELDQDYEAPAGELEEAVAAAFGEVLGLDDVGRHDNFFDLGGDSLVAAQYCRLVRDTTGAQLTVRNVFEAPTVAGLAAELARMTVVAS